METSALLVQPKGDKLQKIWSENFPYFHTPPPKVFTIYNERTKNPGAFREIRRNLVGGISEEIKRSSRRIKENVGGFLCLFSLFKFCVCVVCVLLFV